ncbi:MAG: hypothetical protein KJP18_11235, partial [Gemmatimonadetes bacterium]|nr:hypothetical protein [Gemmatimonadota bacterium]
MISLSVVAIQATAPVQFLPMVPGGGPVVSVLGLPLHNPASVVTNLMLAAQSVIAARILARRAVPGWPVFFVGMALATGLGAFKHGLPWIEPEWVYQTLTGGSNVAVVVAVVGAQRAVLPGAWWLSLLFGSVLVGANSATRDFGATAAILAAGVVPVVGASVFFLLRSARRSRTRRTRECAWLCAGWGAFSLAGVVWA